MGSDSTKFSRLEKTLTSGSTSRGKNTFLIRLALSSTLRVPPATASLQKFQGSRPTIRNTGNIAPADWKKKLKTNQNTSIISSGANCVHK